MHAWEGGAQEPEQQEFGRGDSEAWGGRGGGSHAPFGPRTRFRRAPGSTVHSPYVMKFTIFTFSTAPRTNASVLRERSPPPPSVRAPPRAENKGGRGTGGGEAGGGGGVNAHRSTRGRFRSPAMPSPPPFPPMAVQGRGEPRSLRLLPLAAGRVQASGVFLLNDQARILRTQGSARRGLMNFIFSVLEIYGAGPPDLNLKPFRCPPAAPKANPALRAPSGVMPGGMVGGHVKLDAFWGASCLYNSPSPPSSAVSIDDSAADSDAWTRRVPRQRRPTSLSGAAPPPGPRQL